MEIGSWRSPTAHYPRLRTRQRREILQPSKSGQERKRCAAGDCHASLMLGRALNKRPDRVANGLSPDMGVRAHAAQAALFRVSQHNQNPGDPVTPPVIANGEWDFACPRLRK